MGYIYTPNALTEISPGNFALRSDYDHTIHRVEVIIIDDDSHLDGDWALNEIGDDSNQTANVYDTQGNLLTAGRIYSEQYFELTAPGGHKIYFDAVEIGGTLIGYIPSEPLQEGVTYQRTAIGDVHTGLQNILEGDTRTTYAELASVPCFVAGTSVMTDAGMVPVDWLRPGDRVLTRDRGFQPLLWVGRFEPAAAMEAAKPGDRPVTIAPGALGIGLPAAELRVSPLHRLLIQDRQLQLCFGHDAMLCAARFLIGWPGIRQDPDAPPPVYYHLLLPRHEVVMADGTWAESLFLGDLAQEVVPAATIAELRRRTELAHGGHRRTAYPCLKAWEVRLVTPPGAAEAATDTRRRLRA